MVPAGDRIKGTVLVGWPWSGFPQSDCTVKTDIPDGHDDPVRHVGLTGLWLCAALLLAPAAWSDDSPPAGESAPVTIEKETPPAPAMPKVTSPEEPAVKKPLLTADSLQSNDWVFISREKESKLADTWQVAPGGDDPILVCLGAPYGYLKTQQQYGDFEMELEWRYPSDENGNSGILLYTSDEDKIWPKSIQVQLHQPVAGSIFPSGDARSDNEIRDVRDVARPINEWNVCRISSASGTLSVEINGRKVGEVTGCHPSKGGIALQSEGSEVHFRRIRIRETPPVAVPDPPVEQATSGMMPAVIDGRGISACTPVPATFVSIDTRRRHRRLMRMRKVSHVVHRDALATSGDLCCGGDRLWLDVAGASPVVVAGRPDRLHRSERRRSDF